MRCQRLLNLFVGSLVAVERRRQQLHFLSFFLQFLFKEQPTYLLFLTEKTEQKNKIEKKRETFSFGTSLIHVVLVWYIHSSFHPIFSTFFLLLVYFFTADSTSFSSRDNFFYLVSPYSFLMGLPTTSSLVSFRRLLLLLLMSICILPLFFSLTNVITQKTVGKNIYPLLYISGYLHYYV